MAGRKFKKKNGPTWDPGKFRTNDLVVDTYIIRV